MAIYGKKQPKGPYRVSNNLYIDVVMRLIEPIKETRMNITANNSRLLAEKLLENNYTYVKE